MRIAGIIAEYNPFHNGHAWQIAEAKRRGAQQVVIALSTGLVQRGALPLLPEAVRVRAALDAGADLVIALPAPYASAGAEAFARAGTALLAAAGCDTLVFGTETADAAACLGAARALLSPAYAAALRAQLAGGARSFAAARQAALAAVYPAAAQLAANPNDNLGVEYGKAILTLGLEGALAPLALPRQGAGHHDAAPGAAAGDAGMRRGGIGADKAAFSAAEAQGGERARCSADADGSAPRYASAGALRALWVRQGAAALTPYVPTSALALYAAAQAAGLDIDPAAYSAALLSRLRAQAGSMSAGLGGARGASPFAAVRGTGGGLDRALEKAVRQAVSADALADALTTVRYPRARMRRLALDAALGYTDALPALPAYLHVLGARLPLPLTLHGEADAALCARMGFNGALPVDPSLAALARRSPVLARAAAAQAVAVDFGALCRRSPAPMGEAYRQPCLFAAQDGRGV